MTNTNNPTATHRDWFKASYSTNAASCVEVRFDDNLVHIRDSKYRRNPANPTPEPIISTTPHEWAEFLDKITGRTTHADTTLNTETTPTGTTILRTTQTNTTLTFTPTEWRAFRNGALAHEFDHPATV